MPERAVWPLAIPLAGLLVLAVFVVGMVVALGVISSSPSPGQAKGRNEDVVVVVNDCSRAAQVGWVGVDPVVPFDSNQAGRFFEDAVYVGDSEWPYLDRYSTFANQTAVIVPGEKAELEMGSASPRRRLLLVATFSPKGERAPGSIAGRTVGVFDIGDSVPEHIGLADGENECIPQPPLDRRYRF